MMFTFIVLDELQEKVAVSATPSPLNPFAIILCLVVDHLGNPHIALIPFPN
jgi:hypothetical protein